jgi:hypothetical protein
MSNLFYFLTDLAVNPRKQEAFEKNPDMTMETAGLSELDGIALNSRSRTRITAALADDDLKIGDLAAVMGSCVYSDPGPDPEPDPDPLSGD